MLINAARAYSATEQLAIDRYNVMGYIVEFESEPLIVKASEILKSRQNAQLFTINTADESILILHKSKLKSEKDFVKQEISKTLNKNINNPRILLNEYDSIFNGIVLNLSADEAEKIKKLPGVKNIYPNLEVKATLMNSVPLIGADKVWKMLDSSGKNLTGQGIRIAIIDTGVDYTHPDLGGCFGTGCKIIGGYDFVNLDSNPMDDHGHGTHVAATAAGNGSLKGVAPDAKIYAYKVLDSSGSGTFANVIAGIDRAVDPNNDGNFSDHVDVLSMSLGAQCGAYSNFCGPDDPLSTAVDNAVNAGVIAVIAAGNSGPLEQTIASPGTARKAITVGASDKSDVIASFSSRGPVVLANGSTFLKPDIVAPGVAICAAEWDSWLSDRQCFDNKHIAISGTSMATPHIAGAAALIRQEHPDWTVREIKMALRNGAKDLSYATNIQGYGRLDVLKTALFNQTPSLAEITTGGKVNGTIDILGTASGRMFIRYELYYGLGNNASTWYLLTNSTTAVTNGVLYSNFDTSLLLEGYNLLRLDVFNNKNEVSEDRNILIINELYITKPLNNDNYRLGESLNIIGKVTGKFSNFSVEYSTDGLKWNNNGISLSSGGKGQIIDDVIAIWDTSVVSSGYYTIRLSVNYPNGKVAYEYANDIYLDATLRDGWPVHLDWDISSFGSSTIFESVEFFTLIQKSDNNNMQNGSIKTITKNEYLQMISNPSAKDTFYIFAGFIEPIVADLRNDGIKNVIVYKNGVIPKLIVYNPNGSILWYKNLSPASYGGGQEIPLVGDIDNDGKQEIIIYDTIGSKLLAFKYDGSLLWSAPMPSFEYYPTMLMADLNQDGKKEIVVQGNQGYPRKMTVLDNKGNIISQWSLWQINWGASIEPSPAVGNFDNDDDLEIVSVGPSENAGYNWSNGQWINEGKVTIYEINGSNVSGWPIRTKGIIFSSPAVGDINKDGRDDIVIGLMFAGPAPDPVNGGLYAFDRNGSVLPGWPVEKGWNFWSTPSLSDIDNNGYLEIVSSKLGFVTYLLNYDGTIANGWPQYTAWNDYYSSIRGDVTGDGIPDVLTTAGNGFTPAKYYHGGVYAWKTDGTTIDGFPKVTEVDVQAPAVIEDMNNDGKLELIASSDWDYDFTNNQFKFRSSIYVWNLNTTHNSSAMPWPTFMHDNQHTGRYTKLNGTPQNVFPSILYFSATPNVITAGQDSTLEWNTTNATQVTISGIGTVNSSGSRNVTPIVNTTYTLVASNVIGNVSQSLTVVVISPQNITNLTLVIKTNVLPSAILNKFYSALVEAIGGNGTYKWNIIKGVLPTGLSRSQKCISCPLNISGIPTTLGTFNFTLNVSSGNKNDTKKFSITVNKPLSINANSSLPQARINTTYSFLVRAVGGNGTYEWGLVNGSLPLGLTLSQKCNSCPVNISGNTTSTGIFNFTLNVSSDVETVSKGLTIKVLDTPPFLQFLIPFSGKAKINVTINGSGFTPTQNSVKFGPNYFNNFNSSDGRSINFIIPNSQIGTYKVSVNNTNGVSNILNFRII